MKQVLSTLSLSLMALSANAAYLDEKTGEVVVPTNQELLGEEHSDLDTPNRQDTDFSILIS
ncbi:hypothetical protein JCM19239_1372 [Vibrio variabilis]|uniref:Uncharacterized protein n=1 Tax=Vibrio variabilis TaxID=990271 RepID=A0ABQ0JRP6_9VIBR|nr:hypothetical protein JCM19239_1372 [Vibrio variabilis]